MEVEELPRPTIGPEEILVRVHACGVCGTDLKKIQYGLAPPPRVFGHETAGVVAAVAEGEHEWRPGDRVVVQHHVPCRSCFYCDRRLYSSCAAYQKTGVTAGFEPAGGGFAEYVRVMPFARPGIVRIPDDVTFEEASFLEPLNTVLKGVEGLLPSNDDGRAPGVCLVVGQGPIGLLFTQALRLRGADVIAADLIPMRREMATGWGAAAVDPRETETAEVCRQRTAGRGADFAVVTVPNAALVGEALGAVRPGGRVLLFAHTRLGDFVEVDAGQVCKEEKVLCGSYSSDIDLQPLAASLLFSRRIETAPLVTHRFPIDRIGEAIDVASRPRPDSLKVIVQP